MQSWRLPRAGWTAGQLLHAPVSNLFGAIDMPQTLPLGRVAVVISAAQKSTQTFSVTSSHLLLGRALILSPSDTLALLDFLGKES
eukprot:scaffold37530_cov18-Tisochrysis_lutea.AAC.1